MYYLFTEAGHTPIIVYTKDKHGRAAKEVLARAREKVSYVSKELNLYTQII